MTDEELIQQISAGDTTACRALVDRHLAGLTRFAKRMLGDTAEGEDVAQETFLKLWQTADRFEGRSQVRTFLFRIAHNLAIDRMRKRKRSSPEMDELEDPSPTAAQHLERSERAQRVQRAIATLPERQRTALSLVHFEGLRQLEAAEIMNISVDALESLLARSRRTLRERLVDEEK